MNGAPCPLYDRMHLMKAKRCLSSQTCAANPLDTYPKALDRNLAKHMS